MARIGVRGYGYSGALVVVLHGGPGAPGAVRGVAEGLSDEFRVLEPLQRRHSGGSVLSVERHVQDLAEVMPGPAAIVGHSWGAMLALSFAACRPGSVRSVALVGCGTYDAASRREYRRAFRERLESDAREYDEIAARLADTHEPEARDRLVAARRRLSERAQSFDPIEVPSHEFPADALGAEETWSDVLRLQETGVEPARFAAIDVPALMIHGDRDPHPGRMTYDVLHAHIPQLEYVELPRCGHTPWLERGARGPFLDILRAFLRSTAVT